MNHTTAVGVIADLTHTDSPAYSSYYYACCNLFDNVKLVNNVQDLAEIDVLLCGNDHHINHLNIWSNENFIQYCNSNEIPFFVHTVEHIRTPAYPHNLGIQSTLEKYKFLNQRCWDISDCGERGTALARVLLSKNFHTYREPLEKKNEIAFIGKLYPNRVELISALSKHINIDVVERSTSNNYYEFLSKLAEYKYVLSPKSLFVNGIPGRFYESLWVDSIPLQEVYTDTLNHYTVEKNTPNTIFFTDPEDLLAKLQKPTTFNEPFTKFYLEDELRDFFNQFGLNI